MQITDITPVKPKSNKKIRLAAYARVSTKSEGADTFLFSTDTVLQSVCERTSGIRAFRSLYRRRNNRNGNGKARRIKSTACRL